jgi:hypothetical protein
MTLTEKSFSWLKVKHKQRRNAIAKESSVDGEIPGHAQNNVPLGGMGAS